MNRSVLLSMVVSWLLIGSVMNIEGRRASGLLEQASAHVAPCAPPEYHQFDFWVGDWDVFDVGSQTNTFDAVRGSATAESMPFWSMASAKTLVSCRGCVKP